MSTQHTNDLKRRSKIDLLVGVLCCGLLASCSSQNTDKRASDSDEAEASVETPSPNGPAAQVDTQSGGMSTTPVLPIENSEIAVLKDEPEYLNARWKLLEEAKKSVWIQTYILKNDHTGRQFMKKLIDMKSKGIDVRLIVDEQINLDLNSQGLFARSYQSGLKVLGFNPFYRGVVFPLANAGDLAAYFNANNQRSHEKIFLIDAGDPTAAKAIIGGVNISDDYFRILPAKTGGYYRDKDVIVKGPVVQNISQYYLKSQAVHENMNSNIIRNAVLQPSITAKIQSLLVKDPEVSPVAIAKFNEHTSKEFSPEWTSAKVTFNVQLPKEKRFDVSNEYLRLINSAKSDIMIANGYFIPSTVQIAAIKAAAARGVQVRILTNSEETNDFPQVARAGRLRYATVLSDKSLPISIYEWGIPNSKAHALYHSKFMCIDKVTCVVGSFNFDPRSQNLNSETTVTFESPEAAASLVQTFEEDTDPTTSTQISLDQAKKFSQPDNMKDRLLNILVGNFTPNL